MNDMMFIVLFINKTNIYENDAYFQPITYTPFYIGFNSQYGLYPHFGY